MRALPLAARLYIAGVVAAAFLLLVRAVADLVGSQDAGRARDVALLLALYVVADLFQTRGSADKATIALGSVVILAALLLVGTPGAVLVSVMAAVGQGAPPLHKRAFNSGQAVLSTAAAGLAYHVLGDELSSRQSISPRDFPEILVAVVGAELAFCVVNGLLVSQIVHLTEGLSRRAVWQVTFAHQVIAYLGYGLFGLLLAVLWDEDGAHAGPFAAVLVLLPLFGARWAYQQYVEQQEAYERTIRTLVQAVETKDYYTRGHSERVATGAVMIAHELGMREDRVSMLRYAGILHDVGKLGVPTRVLQKSARLTAEEYAAVQLHPVRGHEMVRQIDFLGEALAGIMHHHERMDGRGYPMGLRGPHIPEFARVIAVADAFDSMTSTRSYRGARTPAEALDELHRCAGSQFDPEVVAAMAEAVGHVGWCPQRAPAVPPSDPTTVAAFDHDDPTTFPPLGEESTA